MRKFRLLLIELFDICSFCKKPLIPFHSMTENMKKNIKLGKAIKEGLEKVCHCSPTKYSSGAKNNKKPSLDYYDNRRYTNDYTK